MNRTPVTLARMATLAGGLLVFGTMGSGPCVAFAVDVITCGQVVAAGEVGDLLGDPDCSGSSISGPNVMLRNGARLRLNGHRIIALNIGVGVEGAVPGIPRAHVEGPGEITGASNSGVGTALGCGIVASGSLRVADVDTHGNRAGICMTYTHRLETENVQITGSLQDGITFVSNVRPKAVTGRFLTITGNGGPGVVTNRGLALLRDSTLAGNGSQGDVNTTRPPRLRNTTCEHSVDATTSGTWGGCSLD